MPQPRRLAPAPVTAAALALAVPAVAWGQATAFEVPVRLGDHDTFERVVPGATLEFEVVAANIAPSGHMGRSNIAPKGNFATRGIDAE